MRTRAPACRAPRPADTPRPAQRSPALARPLTPGLGSCCPAGRALQQLVAGSCARPASTARSLLAQTFPAGVAPAARRAAMPAPTTTLRARPWRFLPRLATRRSALPRRRVSVRCLLAFLLTPQTAHSSSRAAPHKPHTGAADKRSV